MNRISSSSSQRSNKSVSLSSPKLVLVTGGNGFLGKITENLKNTKDNLLNICSKKLGMHIVQQLAKGGHRVRTSIRNLEDKHKIEAIKKVTHDSKYPVQFVAADLSSPET